ncbi:hypothetical protein BLNAU_20316 [Blattamonas nauphoetae]|uniref:Uncharacterized protein n=1 Tax=Blattamonas nauphoetae TaxID=2049346 RepID=A0ABQ9WZ40_9EUKA|nr:hypothetical protein BLNAU_20316 [Blattamonas nauphoetae]
MPPLEQWSSELFYTFVLSLSFVSPHHLHSPLLPPSLLLHAVPLSAFDAVIVGMGGDWSLMRSCLFLSFPVVSPVSSVTPIFYSSSLSLLLIDAVPFSALDVVFAGMGADWSCHERVRESATAEVKILPDGGGGVLNRQDYPGYTIRGAAPFWLAQPFE